MGAGTKAGGPSYLVGLTDWVSVPATRTAPVTGPAARLLDGARRLGLDPNGLLARSLGSDALVWSEELGVPRDVSGLLAEKNVLRHLPVPATVRVEDDSTLPLLRVVAAGLRVGAPVTVSLGAALPDDVRRLLSDAGVPVADQDEAAWAAVLRGDQAPHRVRLIGGTRQRFAAASEGRVDVALYAQPVLEAGRIELLTFLHEQAVAVTAHRFGSPTPLAEDLFTPQMRLV